MRYSLFLGCLFATGLSACAPAGTSVSRYSTTTRVDTASYLTPRQSSDLIVLPGDTTTPVQLRFLTAASRATPNTWRAAGSADPTQQETTALVAGNLSP